jgi:Fe-S cluster assembly iron-binding protein IscA
MSTTESEDEENESHELSINMDQISPSLLKYFENTYKHNNNNDVIRSDWKPPKTHGLTNSFIIIPQYYNKSGEKILSVDYYNMIIDDIRNFRKLNDYQLDYIKELDNESKQTLFLEFNKLMDVIKDFVEIFTDE